MNTLIAAWMAECDPKTASRLCRMMHNAVDEGMDEAQAQDLVEAAALLAAEVLLSVTFQHPEVGDRKAFFAAFLEMFCKRVEWMVRDAPWDAPFPDPQENGHGVRPS